jgi:hypothetical protein
MAEQDLAGKRCGNCKFQGVIEPEFQGQLLCLRKPPTATPIYTFQLNPQGFQGGITKNATYPPAPNHWTCHEWRPRFQSTDGSQLR